LQNPDGTWHPRFFAVRGPSRDSAGLVRSTGHILQWLAFSLPQDRLEDPRLVRAVQYLSEVLGSRQSPWRKVPSRPRDLAAMMHALHALAIYNERVFVPRDAPQPIDEEEPASVASTGQGPDLQ